MFVSYFPVWLLSRHRSRFIEGLPLVRMRVASYISWPKIVLIVVAGGLTAGTLVPFLAAFHVPGGRLVAHIVAVLVCIVLVRTLQCIPEKRLRRWEFAIKTLERLERDWPIERVKRMIRDSQSEDWLRMHQARVDFERHVKPLITWKLMKRKPPFTVDDFLS